MIQLVPPGSNFVGGVSELIPPATDRSTFPFDVPACAGSTDDAVIVTTDFCEVQASEFAPAVSARARSAATVYHSRLRLDDSREPGSAQLFNNHIPLDPILGGAVSISKTTPMLNVTRGQLIPYVITASNSFGVDLQDVSIIDRFPAGFRYVEGSARLDDVATEQEVQSPDPDDIDVHEHQEHGIAADREGAREGQKLLLQRDQQHEQQRHPARYAPLAPSTPALVRRQDGPALGAWPGSMLGFAQLGSNASPVICPLSSAGGRGSLC